MRLIVVILALVIVVIILIILAIMWVIIMAIILMVTLMILTISTNNDGDIDNTTRILHHLNSSDSTSPSSPPILLTLQQIPSSPLYSTLHRAPPPSSPPSKLAYPPQNDPSHLFAHIKSPSTPSRPFSLSSPMPLTSSNGTTPSSPLLLPNRRRPPLLKLRLSPVTNPKTYSLLDTFRFHHNLSSSNSNSPPALTAAGINYLKQLFYVFDAVPGSPRHRPAIASGTSSGTQFQHAARNQHAFIVEELAEADRKESESGSVKG